MAAGRDSPIDWDAERKLAEKGYYWADTDESSGFLDLVSRNCEVQTTGRISPLPLENRREIFQDYDRALPSPRGAREERCQGYNCNLGQPAPRGAREETCQGRNCNRGQPGPRGAREETCQGSTCNLQQTSSGVCQGQDYGRQLTSMIPAFRAMRTEEKPVKKVSLEEAPSKRPMLTPNLPGTPMMKKLEDPQPTFMNRYRHHKSVKREPMSSGGSYDRKEKELGAGRRPKDPPVHTWKETEAYQKAMERKLEEEERKRKAREASEAYGSKPEERPMRFKDGLIRATVWKSSPVPSQVDHRIRDQNSVTLRRNEPDGLEEIRIKSLAMLNPEPDAGPGVFSIKVTLPSTTGKQVQRRFSQHDTLQDLRAFIWSYREVPNNFTAFTGCPRKELSFNAMTLIEAGLANCVIHVDALCNKKSVKAN